jgi:hypothetical protein
MKFRAGFSVSIGAIEPPPDFEARLKAPHVAELAKSIKALGGEPLAPLLVDGVQKVGKWVLVAGRDRLAACQLAGLNAIPVRVVDGATPADLRRLEIAENVFRRVDPDRAKALAEYFGERVAEVLAEREPGCDDDEPAPARFAPPAASSAWVPDKVYSPENRPPTRPVATAGQLSDGETVRRDAGKFAPSPVGIAKAQVLGELSAVTGKSPEALRKTIERVNAPPKPPKPAAPTTDADRSLDGLRRNAKLAEMFAVELAAAFPGREDLQDALVLARALLSKVEDIKLPRVAAVEQTEMGGAA